MSDRRSDAAPRRPRFALLATLVVLALIAGIALMAYAVQRSGGWFIRPAATADTPPPRAAAFNPSQPAPIVPQTAAIDPALLAARESGLSAQLAALEAQTAAVALDARGAAGQAARAEMLLIAAATRRAVEQGAPLGYLEQQLHTRFGAAQPRAVAILIRSARRPLTLEDLRTGFDARAGDWQSGGDDDLLSSLSRELRRLVVIHDERTPSPLPSARVARAGRLLDAGRVGAAAAEVRQLPGARAGAAWLADARRYIRTREALDLIESAATAPLPMAIQTVVPATITPPI